MIVFKATLSSMLTLFLCVIIGYVLNRKKLLPSTTAAVLSKLENYVIVPCLNVSTFMKYATVASLRAKYTLILYCLAAVFIALLLAYLLGGCFARDKDQKNIYRYSIVFGNYGYMGNAIVLALFGQAMLYEYLLYTLPLTFLVYTWGLAVLVPQGGEGKKSALRRLINPGFLSVMAGLLLGLLGAEAYLPSFVTTTIDNLSACMGPIAMILTGFVIGDYHLPTLLKNGRVYLVTFLRLIVLPAIFVGILWLLGASETVLTLTLFAFAMPLGLNTVVFPAAYGGDTSTGASMAMISHTLCVITIPVMYALLTWIL